jgi:hypothetical protein
MTSDKTELDVSFACGFIISSAKITKIGDEIE